MVRRMLHAELVHHMRCEASVQALQMVKTSIAVAWRLLEKDDPQLVNDLQLIEP